MKDLIIRYILITIGILLIDVTYVIVNVPYGIINGGVTSFSMILSKLPLTGLLPVNFWVTVVTILLTVLCGVFLGRDVFIGSLYSCISGTAVFNIFTYITPQWVYDLIFKFGSIGDNPVLPVGTAIELILAAAAVGAGYYFCLANKATAVGMDTIALILHTRNEKIPIAPTMYAINIMVLLLGLVTYGLKCVIMGIAFAGIQAFTLHCLLKLNDKEKEDC